MTSRSIGTALVTVPPLLPAAPASADPNAKDCVPKVQTKFDGGLKPSPCNSRTDRHFLFVMDRSRERGRCSYAEGQSGRRPDVPAAQGVGQLRVGEPRTEESAFAVRKDIRFCATGFSRASVERELSDER